MNDENFPILASAAGEALKELVAWRTELRQRIAQSIGQLDPLDPETLQFAAFAMFEAHYTPKELSALLGPSQTTISRWAMGQTIPRSPPYRKWLVGSLIGHLRGDQPAIDGEATPDPEPDHGEEIETKPEVPGLPRAEKQPPQAPRAGLG